MAISHISGLASENQHTLQRYGASVLRTNLRDTKRNTPGSDRGCFVWVLLVSVAVVAMAVVFFLGRLVHHCRLGGPELQPLAFTPLDEYPMEYSGHARDRFQDADRQRNTAATRRTGAKFRHRCFRRPGGEPHVWHHQS